MKKEFFLRFRDQFSKKSTFNFFVTQCKKLITDCHFEHPEGIKKLKKIQKARQPSKLRSILFVTGVFPDILHGGGLRIFDFIMALISKGINVDLFTITSPQYSKGIISSYKSNLGRFKLAKNNHFNSCELEKFIGKKKYNFIVVVWPWTSSIITPKIYEKNRIIFDFIECTTKRTLLDFCFCRPSIAKVKSFLECLLWELKASSYAMGLIYVTAEDRSFVRKYLSIKQKNLIIPSYINSEFSKTKNTFVKNKNSVCFIGNYDHYPNLNAIEWYLKKVHSKVLKAIPSYRFYIIGFANSNKNKLDSLLASYKALNRSAIYVGFVEKANEELSKYQIAVSPLISGAGFRGKLVQYSMLCKPCVATSLSCAGLPLKHGKNILIADDAQSFANHVIDLLKDKNLQNKISKNAYDLVSRKYTWESNIGPIINKLGRL